MANKPLQSIKFPDLPDTYTIPVVDSTLAVSGAAADAKKTGDELAKKVTAVSGKGLSTEDYTTEEKTKLADVETEATKTTIDSTLTVTGNAADAKAVGDAIANEDKKALTAFVTDMASGSIASFPDGADSIPMKDVLVHIEPVQEGSGDPSPDNVRPIIGWTGAKVARTGKNLCNQPIGRWIWTSAGQRFDNTTGIYCATKDKVPVKGGKQYVVSFTDLGQNSAVYFVWFNEDGFIKADLKWGAPWAATAPQNATKVAITFSNNEKYTGEPKISNVQLELGSTPTDYEPYSVQTYDITFPTEAGTVYGGTLDVTNGVLTVDRAIIASYAGETLPTTWISDRDVYSEGATPTTGAQVCYKLATPITYHLTPQEITSLLGTNNLWADTGDSEVEYRADAKMYITKKITEAVSALS